jgi:hypothetical protein
MKTWRDNGAENAKISNEEMRLKGEAIKSQRQVDHLKDMSDTLDSVKNRLEDLVSTTEIIAAIEEDLSDIKVLLQDDIKVLLQELITHLKKI